MLRDSRSLRRNSGNAENHDPRTAPSAARPELDPSRPPLNAIQNPALAAEHDTARRRDDRTPSKAGRPPASALRTPEKPMTAVTLGRNRFGWASRADSDGSEEITVMVPRGLGFVTPRPVRCVTAAKASSVHSESSSTHSTPNRSVNKPPNPVFTGSRPSLGTGVRAANYTAASRGAPMCLLPPSMVNSVEVPHFELKEDPSFWMDHNVQVVIRVRPLNSTEISLQGYNRCLKQESAQSIAWIGQPETRFMFDHVACETISQETLFRVAGLPMVENCISGYNSCMFAYGQTGSGKTYTMLGEVDELEVQPKSDRGMTPRIFEFLFARVRAEEESRKDEKLKYSCRCSFLEIYNEQITDLLDPSSTNLLVREDIQRGVYVENLSEFAVDNVNAVLKLLVQGAANRKVAATNMNRESSRSHSVFTCTIESQWEKDSLTNLRYARLNLVDLAGSERQKASGAEGERLKEAANINKSLSTLGHVIMLLVDVAQGKQRHIPYRDSRLTFLLQDSLGGNSKTIIIANISPSTFCASETLSTLKFAQRAKLIQNNAMINEDASGDVVALQHQIRLLKEELSMLKRQKVSRSLSFRTVIFRDSDDEKCASPYCDKLPEETLQEGSNLQEGGAMTGIMVSTNQLKSLEAALAGALRRERMADAEIKNLQAEIDQANRLVRQREEDAHCLKMMLKFREDKIQKMANTVNGLVPADSYWKDEINSLTDEIQLLRARADRNPEITRFALENIRLLDQLRRFQEFYEEGEREILLAEVSELRNQLLLFLDRKYESAKESNHCMSVQDIITGSFPNRWNENDSLENELKRTFQELEDCRGELKSCLDANEKLSRELNDLQVEMNDLKNLYNQNMDAQVVDMEVCSGSSPLNTRHPDEPADLRCVSCFKLSEEIVNSQLELDILKTIILEERSLRCTADENAIQINMKYDQIKQELEDAKLLPKSHESIALGIAAEVDQRENNRPSLATSKPAEPEIIMFNKNLGTEFAGEKVESLLHLDLMKQRRSRAENCFPLELKLEKVQASLDRARSLNMRFQDDINAQTSHEKEVGEVCRQVEAETAEVIVCLQEEIMALQKQVHDSNKAELKLKERLLRLESDVRNTRDQLCMMSEDNERLIELLQQKDAELRSFSEEREELASEIAKVLADGEIALDEAIHQTDWMVDAFPQKSWIGEQVTRMIGSITEKNSFIEELHKSLEDAEKVRCDLEWKVKSLGGAMLAITEAQELKRIEMENEIHLLQAQLSEKIFTIYQLEDTIRNSELKIKTAELRAFVALLVVNNLSDINSVCFDELEKRELLVLELTNLNLQKDGILENQILSCSEASEQICLLISRIEEANQNIAELQAKISEEQIHFLSVRDQPDDCVLTSFEINLSKAEEGLKKLSVGLATVYSCMDQYTREEGGSVRCHSGADSIQCLKCDTMNRIPVELTCNNNSVSNIDSVVTGSDVRSPCAAKYYPCEYTAYTSSSIKNLRHPKDLYDKETTILLLQKEIESSLKSLNGVQIQMKQLLQENETAKLSELQTRKDLGHLVNLVVKMYKEMIAREQVFELMLLELDRKIQVHEDHVKGAVSNWQANKTDIFLEVGELKAFAIEKDFEALLHLSQIERSHQTLKEADVMVKELFFAHESTKLELTEHLERESKLLAERDFLLDELSVVRSSQKLFSEKYNMLEAKSYSTFDELKNLVVSLEHVCIQVLTSLSDDLKSVSHDINCFRAMLLHSLGLSRNWLEDIWSEIIGKEFAVSILFFCHFGTLFEAITGLNTENGLLLHGLTSFNTIIADLREQNIKAKMDFVMCSQLKEKLLLDINNSFGRVTKNEKKVEELQAKIQSLDQKIVDLQMLEDFMMSRSKAMGSELTVLMEQLECHNTMGVLDLISKDIEVVALSSELRGRADDLKLLVFQNNDLELQCYRSYGHCEALNTEITLSIIDGDIKNLLLEDMDEKIGILSAEATDAHVKLDASVVNSHMLGLALKQSNYQIAELQNVVKNLEVGCHDYSLRVVELQDEAKRYLNHLSAKNYELSKSEKCIEVLNSDLMSRDKAIENLHHRLQNVASDHVTQLKEAEQETVKLNVKLQLLQDENSTLLDSLLFSEVLLQCINCFVTDCIGVSKNFQFVIVSLQEAMSNLNNELEGRNTELAEAESQNSFITQRFELERNKSCSLHSELMTMFEENIMLKEDVRNLKAIHSQITEDLRENEMNLELSAHDKAIVIAENSRLQERIYCLETSIGNMEADYGSKVSELDETLGQLSIMSERLLLKIHECDFQEAVKKALERDNQHLLDQLVTTEHARHCISSALEINWKDLTNSLQEIDATLNGLDQIFFIKFISFLDILLRDFTSSKEKLSELLEQVSALENSINCLLCQNSFLQCELTKKDELYGRVLLDLTALQQCVSVAEDQKDKLDNLEAVYFSMEAKFILQSDELQQSLDKCQKLEVDLLEKCSLISFLELELQKLQESAVKKLPVEKSKINYLYEELLISKNSLELELVEKTNVIEFLEVELQKVKNLLDQQYDVERELQDNLEKLGEDRNRLNADAITLKEKLTVAKIIAEANEAIAAEVQQLAESSKDYAESKEEEVKLLERSVEELECTIDVLENKVEMIKQEAEKQRLHREDLEIELQALKCQLMELQVSSFNGIIANRENTSVSDEEDIAKEMEEKIKFLKLTLEDKDMEINQYKVHILELNAHAEAQAQQNIEKIKELETMVQQVKMETSTTNMASIATIREKSTTKSRGSGSPFKCIGLGLTQQMNSEKEEELTVARLRIQELEGFVSKLQKEIFQMNTRLAASESMTHDVIRDLLGVKMDITSYASLVDDHEVGKPDFCSNDGKEFEEKLQEIEKLNNHLNELIEERDGWLDDISKRHTEMVAMKVALEKLRQRDQFLSAENEILKGESLKHKKVIMQLECEMEKNHNHNNMQLRIHHHAKIKEENHLLRVQKQDLTARLQRSEEVISRIKEELAHYRSCYGKHPYINFDEEERLKAQLEVAERERERLYEQLISLSSDVLKVAGITEPLPDNRPLLAADALRQLKSHIDSLENELQELNLKNKISKQRMRLDALRQEHSPLCSTKREAFHR